MCIRDRYRDRNRKYNADAVGAYNILRKYLSVSGEKKEPVSYTHLKKKADTGED